MGQVPYLEVDDGKLSIGQTLAICRYLAKSLKASDYFGGATKSDAAKCDMYAETFMDFFTLGVERIFESDPDIKAKKDEKFEAQFPIRLKTFEEHLKKNGGENFVLWCDLVAVAVLSMVEETKADLLQGFPDLRNYYTNMRNLPEIKDYVAQSWPPAASDEA
ncbi:glutathione S-transferase protein [Ancylostoma caninum]|uniref:Glutathione S-transferase protein n=1 Tax=Ancylostoma caninum TaxID=29170 RepID=A0A368FYT0_ANCCA|nr:glutathione S-transferase protein [Ancylostoma caninum]